MSESISVILGIVGVVRPGEERWIVEESDVPIVPDRFVVPAEVAARFRLKRMLLDGADGFCQGFALRRGPARCVSVLVERRPRPRSPWPAFSDVFGNDVFRAAVHGFAEERPPRSIFDAPEVFR